MPVKEYDLIVLGAGAAGGHVASRCKKAGMSVALIEMDGFGGTCPLRGCEPKKVLADAAETVERLHNAKDKGVTGEASIDWQSLMHFKRTFTYISDKVRKHYENLDVDVYQGAARFVSPDSIEVLIHEGGAPDYTFGRATGFDQNPIHTLTARKFCIGTGAVPRPLDFPGSELLSTSTDFLECEKLPERILFIGGGFIAFELAHIAAVAGAEVHIVHRSRQMLKQFDPDLVDVLARHLQHTGVHIHTEMPPHSIEKITDGSGRTSLLLKAGKSGELRIEADMVVHAAGRVPATEYLALDAGNIELEHGGIAVNDHMQSISNPSVYAAGDVVARGLPLTPVASVEAAVVAANLLDASPKTISYNHIPYALFTYPPLAAVGMSEKEAEASGKAFDIITGDASGWSEYERIGQQCAGFKLIVEKDTRQLLGAHMLGDKADEVINLFALAMRTEVDVDTLRNMLWAYPSFGYAMKYMFR